MIGGKLARQAMNRIREGDTIYWKRPIDSGWTRGTVFQRGGELWIKSPIGVVNPLEYIAGSAWIKYPGEQDG